MINTSQTGPDWEKVLAQRPRLRSHIEFFPQRYRGERWYVIHDRLSGKQTRVNATAYDFIGRLDGVLTTAEAIQQLTGNPDCSMTPVEALSLLQQLSAMGALSDGVPIEVAALEAHHIKSQRAARLAKWGNPLAVRIPLLDPEAFVARWTPRLRLLLGWGALWAWLALLTLSIAVCFANLDQLGKHFNQVLTSPSYLLLVWCLYPLMKVVHEMAHAVFLKKGGGEVHEFGITLLLFTPVPYVDASEAWTFSSRRDRMMVSAAGIFAELAIASIALLLWASMEPGTLRDIMFVLFLTGSLSTLLFNANPLLKFDGYYVLVDLLEIPNLYRRAQRYHLYLMQRYLLRVEDVSSPVTEPGERFWLYFYGVAAFVYRNIIMLLIAIWLLGKFFIVGFLVTSWIVLQQYVLPMFRALRYLVKAPEFAERRVWTLSASAMTLTVFLLILMFVPVPHKTRAEGIVWVPEQAQLFAASSGIVSEVMVQPGDRVAAGDVIAKLDAPDLDTLIKTSEARLMAIEAREIAERVLNDDKPQVSADDLFALRATLAEYKRQQRDLTIRAKTTGVFVADDSQALEGRFFAQGDLIGHIVDRAQLVVRVVVPEHRIGSIQQGVIRSQVRLAERFHEIVPAELVHQTPSADNMLPSRALGVQGGGGIAIAADDTNGLKTTERVFHLELSLPPDLKVSGVGERAYVNLEHASVPLLDKWLRSTRQLFLRQLPDYAT